MELAVTEPHQYVASSVSKDDTEAIKMAYDALRAQGVKAPTLAQAAGVVARSK
jgi:hypothetical protein